MKEVKNHKQKCSHPAFYTMGNDKAYCNTCHHYLGYFSPYVSPFGFVKETKDTIDDEHINEEIRRHKTGYYLM